MVVDLEIEASVEIRPGIPIQNRSDLARVLQEECDIVVLSSHSETFGCALTEAIACGKPVVSTRCGGPEDIITESFLGELCENENTDALREALVNVARRITTYDQNRIRAHTLNTFSYGTIARKLREIYQQTLSARDKI